eukprot:972184_1
MTAIEKLAAKYNSPEQAIPTAALSHKLAAVVKPWTDCAFDSLSVCFHIIPAPKNPTPDGMAADTRDASHPIGPSIKAKVPQIEKRHAPSDTSDMVLIPAGRSACHSHPIIAPNNAANTIRLPKVHS